jgi:branched-chain amino acid transport system substrate-binding protein
MAATGAAAAVAGFPAVLKAQAREVKVGYLLPVTGPLAFEAALALNGLTLAVEEINASGGVVARGVKITSRRYPEQGRAGHPRPRASSTRAR